MKQLKFMIAATAAIGLAGAVQAFPADATDAAGNTGFEDLAVGPVATVTDDATTYQDAYFLYTGTQAADNESAIIAGNSGKVTGSLRAKGPKFDAKANVLQVNTGTDPLLRTISNVANGGSTAVNIPAETGIYIDTLVQFTVTPAGDTVTPGEDDKLMIYLQEVAATETTAAATNLVVVAGYTEDGATISSDSKEYIVNNVVVEPGNWYRLTVKAYDTVYTDTSAILPAFTVSINGTLCAFDKQSFGDTGAAMLLAGGKSEIQSILTQGTRLVFSRLQTATLKAVGFAGEGLVDDIVFSTTLGELTTAIDFTFTWGEGISGVTYVIGTDTDNPATAVSGTAFKVEPGKQITVTVTAADWYKYEGDSVFTAGNVAQTNVLEATKLVNDVDGAIVVAEGTTATDLGITGTFAAQGTTTADLQGALNWAMKVIGKTATSDVTALVSGLTFDAKGNAASTDADAKALEEAYLLNCAVADIETKKAAFKFAAFTPGELPAISGEGYNGTVVVEGKGALGDAEWAEATEDNKGNLNFFRARLKK